MCLCEYLSQPEHQTRFDSFVTHKFGYGRWSAPYWFVGPEEAGGGDCVELTRRIQAWRPINGEPVNALEDLREYCGAIGIEQFHRILNPRSQPTWCALIKLLGNAQGTAPFWETEDRPGWVLGLQQNLLGRAGGEPSDHDIALLDLSPLPSPNTDLWLWKCLFRANDPQRSHFADRPAFFNRVLPGDRTFAQRRVDELRKRIDKYKPPLVVLYGLQRGPFTAALNQWPRIPLPVVDPLPNGVLVYGFGPTTLLSMPHPASFRGSWDERAMTIRQCLRAARPELL